MAIITISRQFGSGGEYVCERVADKLGFKFVHKELIKYISILTDTDEDRIVKFDEESHSTLRSIMSKYFDMDVFSDLFKKDNKVREKQNLWEEEKLTFFDKYQATDVAFDSSRFQNLMERLILQMYDEADTVIMGRGGQCILSDKKQAYHFRLVAPLNDRIEWVMNREELSENQAAVRIKDIDAKKKNFIKHYYNMDIDDPNLYHGVVSMHRNTIEEVACIIESIVKIKMKLD